MNEWGLQLTEHIEGVRDIQDWEIGELRHSHGMDIRNRLREVELCVLSWNEINDVYVGE
jgi:hypothetical protein